MEQYMERYTLWANDPYFPDAVHAELQGLSPEEIRDRFEETLQFGTGGLRGIIGAGTNRINVWTVAWATQGFALSLCRQGAEVMQRGVCISYDSRHDSDLYAETAALVFATHGIPVRLFPTLAPTPLLSYAVRYFRASGGVMITASHNPAAYNGYKAYGEDGGQLPPEAADRVIAAMQELTDIRSLRWITKEEAVARGLLTYIPDSMIDDYFAMLGRLSIARDCVRKHADMRVVYTPLNGAGNRFVRRVLAESGLREVSVVPEQELPDPDFTTCPYPNPEAREALEKAMALAAEREADLVIATDPDSDRMGACVRLPDGSYRVLTGNQIGLLLMDYILSAKQERGLLPDKAFVATTIVSTRLVHRVARAFGVKLYEVLTGFKFIGELIANLDEKGDERFQFGFEESYGYLAGTDVRDKDAVVAAMLLVELAARCTEEGKNLSTHLESLYRKYGYGKETTVSIALEGLAGLRRLQGLMESLRAESGSDWAGLPVSARRDYKQGLRRTFGAAPGEEALTLPPSNVLLYELEGDDWACVRPSGTEPKLKVYVGCYGADAPEVEARIEAYCARIRADLQRRLEADPVS